MGRIEPVSSASHSLAKPNDTSYWGVNVAHAVFQSYGDMLVRIGHVERSLIEFGLVTFQISVDLSQHESYPTELERGSDRESVRDMSLPRIELEVLASRRIASLDVGVLLSVESRFQHGPGNVAMRIFAEYRSWRRVG